MILLFCSYFSLLLFYFYCAKAILLTKGIKTKLPDEHKKTFLEFKKNFVDNGKLDAELFKIYNEMIIKANELLSLFSHEKWKEGHFTYYTLAQANINPAKESIENAIKFASNIKKILEK